MDRQQVRTRLIQLLQVKNPSDLLGGLKNILNDCMSPGTQPKLCETFTKEALEDSNYDSSYVISFLDFARRKKCFEDYLTTKNDVPCIVIPTDHADSFINWYPQNKNMFPLNELQAALILSSPAEVKKDHRIDSFIKFGDFGPRPAEAPPATTPPTTETFADFLVKHDKCEGLEGRERCAGDWCFAHRKNQKDYFKDCEDIWCHDRSYPAYNSQECISVRGECSGKNADECS